MGSMSDLIVTHGQALDLFDGELARTSKSPSTRRHYRGHLNHLADDAERHGKRYANQ